MDDRKYTAVGFSTLDGVVKLRFTTDQYRIRVLERNGHSDVQLWETPREMTKVQAVKFLQETRGVPASVKKLCREFMETEGVVEPVSRNTRKGAGTPAQTRGGRRSAGAGRNTGRQAEAA